MMLLLLLPPLLLLLPPLLLLLAPHVPTRLSFAWKVPMQHLTAA
jgi:hypothetical protein